MDRYVALLRGINVSGKNKITMSALKNEFEKLGYKDIVTYLNSGNIIFSSEKNDISSLIAEIEKMIKEVFDLEIPIFLVIQEELKELLKVVPEWWGNEDKDIYDNLIFMMPTLSYETLHEELGDPKDQYEKIHNYKNVVFWSFIRKDYQKTNWWSKTAKSNISDKITIRTANTIRKIVEM